MKLRWLALIGLPLFLGASPPAPAPPALVVETRRAVSGYRNPAAAWTAGYRPASVTGPVEHWLNASLSDDGHILDPGRPEGLVYLRTDHGLRLVAAMFMLDRPGQDGPDVPGASWHHHTWCQGPGGIGVGLPGGSCPPGTTDQAGPGMLHVWMAGISVAPYAADMAPSLRCLVAGTSNRLSHLFPGPRRPGGLA